MKNLIIVIISIFTSTFTIAQETNRINIAERVSYVDKNPTFEASVVISEYYANYGSNSLSSKELMDEFEKKLDQKGIDLNNIEKDRNGYNTLNMNKEGMLYRYNTKSLADLNKFVEIKAIGSGGTFYDYIVKIDAVSEGQIVKNALDKAKKRASEIAQNTNMKLGRLIKLKTSYTGDEWRRAISRDTKIGEIIFDIEFEFEVTE